MAGTKDESDRGALRPIRIRERTTTSPDAVYGLLADLGSHLVWGGEGQSAGFRLLTLDAPEGPATVGAEFHSTGTDGRHRVNHDRSVVTEASRPSAFEYVTESRSVGEDGTTAYEATIVHRFELRASGSGGCEVAYTFHAVRQQPALAVFRVPVLSWLVLRVVRSMLRRGIRNLAALAEERATATVAAWEEKRMTTNGNTAIVERLLAAFNDRNLDALDDLLSPDVVLHGAGAQGLEGMKADIRGFVESFPDARADLQDLVDMGDKVVFRDVCSGTNTGEFYGGPPTGRRISYTEVTALRISGGRVVEAWYFHDDAEFMRQMGLAPEEQPA